MENREQPDKILVGLGSEEQVEVEAGEQILNGSQSKFKDVKSLEQAYLNLQSEFTRKCQRLSELEKSSGDNLLTKNASDSANNNEIDSDSDSTSESDKPQVSKPFYEMEGWQESVNNFLTIHPDASEFASEIVNEILMDKDLAFSPNSLTNAYNKILASKYIPKQNLLEDEDFVNNYILTNEKIKEKIINNYIKNLNNNTPKVISSSHLSSVGLTPNKKPTTLEEAKLLAKNMFK